MELEVCVDSLFSARAAVNGGADRLELCAGLCCDGLTPSIGFCRKTKEVCCIPNYIMIRPRPGEFIYNEDEIDIMQCDIDNLREYADGFVIGCLQDNGEIALNQMSSFIDIIGQCPITFHRAIDVSRDPLAIINKLIELTESKCLNSTFRVLTSGGRPNALEGSDVICQMVNTVLKSSKIKIMAGGGISEGNVQEILYRTNVRAIHGSFSVSKGQSKFTTEESVRRVRMILDNFDGNK